MPKKSNKIYWTLVLVGGLVALLLIIWLFGDQDFSQYYQEGNDVIHHPLFFPLLFASLTIHQGIVGLIFTD